MNHKFVAYLKNEHPRVASILSRAYAIKALPGNRKAVRRSKRCDLPEGLLRSVKRGEAIEASEVAGLVSSGDIIEGRGFLRALGLWDEMSAILERGYGIPLDEIGALHTLLEPEEILAKTAALKLDSELLALECTILRSLFASERELYVEFMPNLRPHVPFGSLRSAESRIEDSIGRGKMNAHGPHKDSWRFHPKNAINVWLALSAATPRNGMFLLPDSREYWPRFADNEIVPGCHTYPERQHHTDCQAGDIVIFAAELIHGSILNQTQETRFAFSMRCSVEEPDFHKTFMYNYARVKPSFSNLTRQKLLCSNDFAPPARDDYSTDFGQQTSRLELLEVGEEEIVVQTADGPARFPRRCPHKGSDLQYGILEGDCVVCPQHQMRVSQRRSI